MSRAAHTPEHAEAAERAPARRPGQRSVVLVGLMGAGKTTIGRRLAARLGLPFHDSDAEVERAAGITVAELFARYGEAEFRRGEQGVIRRLLSGPPIVLATGGGAFMDEATRAVVRRQAVSVWLRCPLDVLERRVGVRQHRPLLREGRPRDVLSALMTRRHPVYAEADLVVDCGENSVDHATDQVLDALSRHVPPRRLAVALPCGGYEVVIGSGLVARAGALLAPVLPRKRAVVVTNETVAALHLPTLLAGLAETGIEASPIVLPPGAASKDLAGCGRLAEAMLALGVEERTAVIALGGGAVGDLAGLAAATVPGGMPLVQVPTTLLAQAGSSVGGKARPGAFHQPVAVLADTDLLRTLPPRELRAGYAGVLKAGLTGDPALFDWCERYGAALLDGDPAVQAEAVWRACAVKAGVLARDERGHMPGGRTLLDLGHGFGHALEAELGQDGSLLHGEALGIGLLLAFRLSVRLGACPEADAQRVAAHLRRMGMKVGIGAWGRPVAADALLAHMQRDGTMPDGRLSLVLVRGIGQAFGSTGVALETVLALLADEGATPAG